MSRRVFAQSTSRSRVRQRVLRSPHPRANVIRISVLSFPWVLHSRRARLGNASAFDRGSHRLSKKPKGSARDECGPFDRFVDPIVCTVFGSHCLVGRRCRRIGYHSVMTAARPAHSLTLTTALGNALLTKDVA